MSKAGRDFPTSPMNQPHCPGETKKWMAVKKEKKEELLSPFLHVILDELGSVFLQDLIDLID